MDLYDEAFERRSSDLHGIANLKLQTVASFLGFQGQSHNSLEDARMTDACLRVLSRVGSS